MRCLLHDHRNGPTRNFRQSLEYAGAYATIHHALSLKLATDIARIFDVGVGREPDKQDKASIPILVHHLGKPEVAAEFVRRSQSWTNTPSQIAVAPKAACQAAIDLVITSASELETGKIAEALKRIRDLRNRCHAHMLFDKEPDPLPNYRDLFLLLKLARVIATPAVLAVEGEVVLFEGNEQFARRDAEQFWQRVLQGILAEA
jgi:hypothetical protein